MQETVVGRHAG